MTWYLLALKRFEVGSFPALRLTAATTRLPFASPQGVGHHLKP
jgi:hypothetical protein